MLREGNLISQKYLNAESNICILTASLPDELWRRPIVPAILHNAPVLSRPRLAPRNLVSFDTLCQILEPFLTVRFVFVLHVFFLFLFILVLCLFKCFSGSFDFFLFHFFG